MRTVESSSTSNASTELAGLAPTLLADPLRGIRIPLVTVIRDHSGGLLDELPSAMVIHSGLQSLPNELAAVPGPGNRVHLSHQQVVHMNVQTHAQSVAQLVRRRAR